ncbi:MULTISPECIES: CAF17-like 4Fe-4S cluster assembly/insertion protein YgfZ [Brucella]|uniref:Glycine cleavage T-protein barrel n=1 Tax=Brucella anthropi (strain ATCC 49188 / DSM 6882 / CCUG 24695 / JCM 21032 / LMG 3331 / NBRC 15819 / NCTC 12168 / Alc 37) TaxID=439375 RepID=A6X281_BRUA4|nr:MULTISPECIES: folate-binding protein YgfZ [Brucella]ABS15335.1 Glycine cleavage T-protein barrel [Brucella anthropi ATCC 49188]UGQ21846.1 folate-binding protein YgfZ [Brucella anthropi]UYT57429.1 folate-binding protein YgfZ [Brucella sp. MAB-22]SUA61687.1 tRNA-modifying protein ygfZ [Brucella anthropi]
MTTAVEVVNLSNRALVHITGEEAEKFLQAVITTDLDKLGPDNLKPGALLAPQGKILFDFLVSRIDGGLRFDLPASIAADFIKRITLYRLRAKAEITQLPESLVSVSWQTESHPSQNDSIKRDSRFPTELNVHRIYGPADGTTDESAWTKLRAEYGIAEGETDFAYNDVFPHDVNFDQTGGVSFPKGCFIGQEVVSRMQHRGTARRRVLVAHSDGNLPPMGTSITVDGREIGTTGSSADTIGIALVRIDRAKDAIDAGSPILAGETPITLTLPPHVRFAFPEAEAGNA